MLTAYLTATRALLQLPGSNSTSLYSDADLTRYINTARGQMAGEAECIRALATIPTVQGQQPYNFASLTIGVAGIDGALHVRSIRWSVGNGTIWIPNRPWEWFELYDLNNAAPGQGAPTSWSQYQQGAAPGHTGSAGGGSFYIGPQPDAVYTLNCDCVCYPSALAVDGDPEMIPYLFTDAVPYFAAYYALMSSQTNARLNDALNYYKIYQEFVDRARNASNGMPNQWQYERASDPAQASKFGAKAGGGAQ
jgi:hypothetical protein